MAAFSTQTSIEARISATRLKTYTDFDGDGTPDAATIAAGIAFAGAYIAGRLESRYGATEIATWNATTAPDLVKKLSDDLCIYQYSISRPELFPESTAAILDTVNEMLDKIADNRVSLYGVDEATTEIYVTERSKSDFDPEKLPEDMSVNPYWIRADPRDLPDYPE